MCLVFKGGDVMSKEFKFWNTFGMIAISFVPGLAICAAKTGNFAYTLVSYVFCVIAFVSNIKMSMIPNRQKNE